MTYQNEDRKYDDRPIRFLNIKQVQDRVGLGKTMIYKLMKCDEHNFPKPAKVGSRSLWSEVEIADWQAGIIASRQTN